MVTVGEIYSYIDSIAPFDTQMDFDNSGLLVGSKNDKVDKVLLALDITNEVVEEANNLNANLIISHHPIIFKPIKSLSSDSIPYKLAKYGISAICAHTNLDMSNQGVNKCLADALGLKDTKPLTIYKEQKYHKIIVFVPKDSANKIRDVINESGVAKIGNYEGCTFSSIGEGRFRPCNGANPFIGEINKVEVVEEVKIEFICPSTKTNDIVDIIKESHPYEEPAIDIFETISIEDKVVLGLIGNLEKEFEPAHFARYVKECLNCNGVKYSNGKNNVKTVGLCSGGAGEFVFDAIKNNVDAFVTGEMKHHEVLAAASHGITTVQAGHFASEDVVILPLMHLLSQKFNNIDFVKSGKLKEMDFYIV